MKQGLMEISQAYTGKKLFSLASTITNSPLNVSQTWINAQVHHLQPRNLSSVLVRVYKIFKRSYGILNPYSPNVTFLYPLKTSENRRFSDIFRVYRNATLGEYGLIWELKNKRMGFRVDCEWQGGFSQEEV